MYDGSDTVILFEELAYQDVLPVAWRPLPDQIDPDLAASYTASNVRVLQACTALQEQGQVEKADENSPHAAGFPAPGAEDQPAARRGGAHPRREPAPAAFGGDSLQCARRHVSGGGAAAPARGSRLGRDLSARVRGGAAAAHRARGQRVAGGGGEGALPAAGGSGFGSAREAGLSPAPPSGGRQSAAASSRLQAGAKEPSVRESPQSPGG